jgi:hypothetical protein
MNMIRIFLVLICLIALIYAGFTTYNFVNSRISYHPIVTPTPNNNQNIPTMENFQDRLNKYYQEHGISAIAKMPTSTPTLKPDSTIVPIPSTIIITPKPIPIITPKPIPTERITPLKAGDSSKILMVSDGADTLDLAYEPSTLYLGKEYYYRGDYAVFRMQFINVGSTQITNPDVKINVYKSNIPVYSMSSKLDIDLAPLGKSDIQYFDLTIPNFAGFYKIVFDVFDKDDKRRLISFYKEINIL